MEFATVTELRLHPNSFCSGRTMRLKACTPIAAKPVKWLSAAKATITQR